MSKKTVSGRTALLHWSQRCTSGYKGVSVTNFHTSWRDGLAFCALIHHHNPAAIGDFNKLSSKNALQNNALAFSVGEKLGIPALLDAEDMLIGPKPEQFSVMTYLGMCYHFFSKGDARAGGAINNIKTSAYDPSSSSSSSSPQPSAPKPIGGRGFRGAATTSTLSSSNGSSSSSSRRATAGQEKCHRCHMHLSGSVAKFNGHSYHARCFTCHSCSRELKSAVLNVRNEPHCDSCGRRAFVSSSAVGSRSGGGSGMRPSGRPSNYAKPKESEGDMLRRERAKREQEMAERRKQKQEEQRRKEQDALNKKRALEREEQARKEQAARDRREKEARDRREKEAAAQKQREIERKAREERLRKEKDERLRKEKEAAAASERREWERKMEQEKNRKERERKEREAIAERQKREQAEKDKAQKEIAAKQTKNQSKAEQERAARRRRMEEAQKRAEERQKAQAAAKISGLVSTQQQQQQSQARSQKQEQEERERLEAERMQKSLDAARDRMFLQSRPLKVAEPSAEEKRAAEKAEFLRVEEEMRAKRNLRGESQRPTNPFEKPALPSRSKFSPKPKPPVPIKPSANSTNPFEKPPVPLRSSAKKHSPEKPRSPALPPRKSPEIGRNSFASKPAVPTRKNLKPLSGGSGSKPPVPSRASLRKSPDVRLSAAEKARRARKEAEEIAREELEADQEFRALQEAIHAREIEREERVAEAEFKALEEATQRRMQTTPAIPTRTTPSQNPPLPSREPPAMDGSDSAPPKPRRAPPPLESRESFASFQTFGVSLSDLMLVQENMFPGLELPLVYSSLKRLIISNGGLSEEGIFRISASSSLIDRLKDTFSKGVFDFEFEGTPHAPACALKQWLAELKLPVVPYEEAERLTNMQTFDDLKSIENWPTPHRNLFIDLITFLRRFVRNSDVNLMTADALAIVFSPAIFQTDKLDPILFSKRTTRETQIVKTLIGSSHRLPALAPVDLLELRPDIPASVVERSLIVGDHLEGFLLKRNPKGFGWKKRWFTYGNGRLMYYNQDKSKTGKKSLGRKSSNKDAMKGFISLHNATVQVGSVEVDDKHTFTVATPERAYTLQAADDDEMHYWVETLQGKLVEMTNSKQKVTTPPPYEGMLMRKGKLGKWKKVFVLLKDAVFYTYKSKGAGKPLGKYYVYGAHFEEHEPLADTCVAFRVRAATGKDVVLKAKDEMEMHSWIKQCLIQRMWIEDQIAGVQE